MPNEIKVEKTIHETLQQDVRLPLSKMSLKKSGHNNHLNYDYFELGDFLPQATELLAKAGMCTVFKIAYDQNGVEMATLTLIKGNEQIVFTTPTAEVPNMNGIFNLGSKHTYCKRYLYVNLLDLTETDGAEISNEGKADASKEVKKATAKQIEMIKSYYDEENQAKMLEYYHIEKLEDLSIKDASALIQRKKG